MTYRILVLLACLILPTGALAAGAHEGLTCRGCHAAHAAKGEAIFAVAPNAKDVNKRTGQPNSGATALCLGCHQAPDKGGVGIKPVESHISHPYGLRSVNAKVAHVPAELLKDGKFECTSCHDPHPSNPNYKYLRIDTSAGDQMDRFCAACHPMKAEAKQSQGLELFSSMDENRPRPAAPAPAKKN
jgi:predicted CXXCH cytochrome family protein